MSGKSEASIGENYSRLRAELPDEVSIVAAAKSRGAEEIAQVLEAGASIIGENYVQETRAVKRKLGERAGGARWHMIGHLQRNKINKALRLFDLVQTVDSLRLARGIDRRAEAPREVYVQVNVAGQESKFGIAPEGVGQFLEQVSALEHLRVKGLMAMEPYYEDPENARPHLRRMREIYDRMRELELPNVELKVLSMGMSNSYRVAVKEGANMVRVGTAIFGPRRRGRTH